MTSLRHVMPDNFYEDSWELVSIFISNLGMLLLIISTKRGFVTICGVFLISDACHLLRFAVFYQKLCILISI